MGADLGAGRESAALPRDHQVAHAWILVHAGVWFRRCGRLCLQCCIACVGTQHGTPPHAVARDSPSQQLRVLRTIRATWGNRRANNGSPAPRTHRAFVNGVVLLDAVAETRARQREVEVQTGLLSAARNLRQVVALCAAAVQPPTQSAAAVQPQ